MATPAFDSNLPRPKQPYKTLRLSLMWLGIATSASVLTLLVQTVCSHDSNHTGFEPWLLAVVFAPTAALSVLAIRARTSIPVAIFAGLLGVGGIGYLIYIDSTNRLVQYERWIDRGMPGR
jgi:hypothetical protein